MTGRRIKYISALLLIIALIGIFFIYRVMYDDTVGTGGKKAVLLIPTGADWEQVVDTIKAKLVIKNFQLLDLVAKRKRYPGHVKAGRYVIERNQSYIDLINTLRSGRQTPVDVTFSNPRSLNQLAGKLGKYLETDSSQIAAFLNEPSNYRNDGFTRENVISVFIPNTYQIYWNTSAEGLYSRMLKEYNKFWNEGRISRAREKKLTRTEVAILASIIDDEVTKRDEKPRIAGVYLNRLKKGIPLQACPTIKFALNDFTINRILYKHLQVDSPYNTYKHSGFPPGPIGCPTIEGLDAVLNAEKHDYLFFAAKSDFSGYHNFSRTLAEHNRYAALYQKELDKRKIYK